MSAAQSQEGQGSSPASNSGAEQEAEQEQRTSAYARLLAYESSSFFAHLHPCHQDDSAVSEEEESESDSPAGHWTSEEIAKLWPALSRHSRLRPDAIAAQIGKSTAQVCELLVLLERRSEETKAGWTLRDRGVLWDSIEAAREVGEEWLALEEEQSRLLERNEAALLMRIAVEGQALSSSSSQPEQVHLLDALSPFTSLLSPLSWNVQLHAVILFLRHHLTPSFHGNFESLQVNEAPIYSLQAANEALCTPSSAYFRYASTHPVPQWPDVEAASEALKLLWSQAEQCGLLIAVEASLHRYAGVKAKPWKIRRKLGGRANAYFVWSDQLLALLPESSSVAAAEVVETPRSNFAAPEEEMTIEQISERGRSAVLHFAQARASAKLRIMASLSVEELEQLGVAQVALEQEEEEGSQGSSGDAGGQASDVEKDSQAERGSNAEEEQEAEEASARPRKKRRMAEDEEEETEEIQSRWSAVGIDEDKLKAEAQALGRIVGDVLDFGGVARLLSAQQDDESSDAAQPRSISAPTLLHLASHLHHFLHLVISQLAIRHTKQQTAKEINDALLVLAPPLSTQLPGSKPFLAYPAARLDSAARANMELDPPVDWRGLLKPKTGMKRLLAGFDASSAAVDEKTDDRELRSAFEVPSSPVFVAIKEATASSAAVSASKSEERDEEVASDYESDFSSLYEDSEEEAAAVNAKRRVAQLARGVVPLGVDADAAALATERQERRQNEEAELAKWNVIEKRDEERDRLFEETEWSRWTRRRSKRSMGEKRKMPVLMDIGAVKADEEEEEEEEEASSVVSTQRSRSASRSDDDEASQGSASS